MKSGPGGSPLPFSFNAPTTVAPVVRRRISRKRLWAFRVLACVGLPAITLVVAEAVLRLMGVGYPTGFLEPFEPKPGYLADNYKFAWRFFPKDLARTSQPILTTKAKPADVLRIVVFGGSAAMGDPEPAYGMPRVLQTLFAARFPNRKFEVINAAVTAINSHVVLSIAADCRQLDADAWVVYMGNNEVHGPFGAGTVFTNTNTPRWLIRSGLALKQTKLGQMLTRSNDKGAGESWGGMAMFLEHQVRHDDPAMARVYANFEQNLDAVCNLAKRSGTPIVVSTVVTNLGDSRPFISLNRHDMSPEDLEQWRAAYVQGCNDQEYGRFEEALDSFRVATKIDDQHAELAYRTAECLRDLGTIDEARAMFVQARELDALRFRADSNINETIRTTVANRDGVCFVDAEQKFTELSENHIVGSEYFYEHVHFNFAGNYQLAKLLADGIVAELNLPADGEWPAEDQCATTLGLTPYHRSTIAQEMVSRLIVPPFSQQAHHDQQIQRMKEAIAELQKSMTPEAGRNAVVQFEQSIRQNPDDWRLHWQYGLLLESVGKLSETVAQQREVVRILPHHWQGYFRLGTLLNRTKQWGEAENMLRATLQYRPDYPPALNSLGIAISQQSRPTEANVEFEKAVALKPDFAEAYYNWGLVMASQGDENGALERFHATVKADPNYLAAHVRLAKHFIDRDEPSDALPHYQAVARLLPNDVDAQLNLGMLSIKMGNTADAIDQMKRVLRIDPDNQTARQALQSLEGGFQTLDGDL